MAQLVTLANAIIAVLPAATIFFLAYGRYDGTFRDNVVFLYFIGGLILGAALGVFTLFTLAVPVSILTPLLLALFYPIAVIAGINRRRWQGERHAVFNGGALGLGVSVMLSFTLLFVFFKELSAASLGQAALLATALAGMLFGVGLLCGNAVRRRTPFRVALLATATLLAPAVFLVTFASDRVWLWLALLVAYGLVYAVAAERKVLIEGVAEEARKQRRRLRRKAA